MNSIKTWTISIPDEEFFCLRTQIDRFSDNYDGDAIEDIVISRGGFGGVLSDGFRISAIGTEIQIEIFRQRFAEQFPNVAMEPYPGK